MEFVVFASLFFVLFVLLCWLQVLTILDFKDNLFKMNELFFKSGQVLHIDVPKTFKETKLLYFKLKAYRKYSAYQDFAIWLLGENDGL